LCCLFINLARGSRIPSRVGFLAEFHMQLFLNIPLLSGYLGEFAFMAADLTAPLARLDAGAVVDRAGKQLLLPGFDVV
jgi:hypothetical protein